MTFDDFWQAYPRRTAKGNAVKAWEKATKTTDPEKIMEGVRRFNEHLERSPRDKEFIKHPATWLNQECWDDEYEAPQKAYAEGMATLRDRPKNPVPMSFKIFDDELMPAIMQRWAETGYKHWWHVAARIKQARRLANLRAAARCGVLRDQAVLDDAEREYAAGRLPDALREMADSQEKAFGDPARKEQAA